MSKKNQKIYMDILYGHLKFSIFAIFITIVIAIVFMCSFGNNLKAKENGEKISAKVIKIDEQSNPLDDPYEKDRKINTITIEYNYNNKEYTYSTSTVPYKYVAINDIIDIYIMNNNPNDVVVYAYNSSIIPYIVIPLFGIIFIASVCSCVSTIKQINLYKNALNNFDSIKARYVDVEVKTFLGYSKYFIICESDEINGNKMIFKSHSYGEHYLKSEIEKRNIQQFTVMYNRNNLKQYIVDTNTIDKIMYK